MHRGRRAVAVVLAAVGTVAATTLVVAPANASSASSTVATPSAAAPTAESRKVDRVPTPRPRWFTCSQLAPGATCASVPLPLDYDDPTGPTTDVAVLRVPARKPAHRIGTLFLNPGGPGGSGVEMAAASSFFLSPDLLDRFDVVGFDPRGTNFSDPVRCWGNLGDQSDALGPILSTPFPYRRAQTGPYVRAAEAFGRACSTTGRPLSGSMSTAEVARDLDVLRRMTGDARLTYLGFSYGSYLGTVYASMFPNRVRAVAVDGVIDPVAWAGTAATAGFPQTQRLRSGEAAARAVHELLVRCGRAGRLFCQLAGRGDPVRTYASITTRLKAAPARVVDPETGEVLYEVTYPVLVALLLGVLYAPDAGSGVDAVLSEVASILEQPAPAGTLAARRQAAARAALAARIDGRAEAARSAARAKERLARSTGWAFPYDNSPEAFQSVLCTDGLNPARASSWARAAEVGDRRAPGFGRLWTWASAPCASSTWTVRDEDAYRGPFTRRTENPVLVVGNYWDPATSYQGAVTTARLLPGSRLLSSDSWGHTAYGTSACVTGAVGRYLLTQRLPVAGATCVGDLQPFTQPLEDGAPRPPAARRPLPPVVPPFAGAVPRR